MQMLDRLIDKIKQAGARWFVPEGMGMRHCTGQYEGCRVLIGQVPYRSMYLTAHAIQRTKLSVPHVQNRQIDQDKRAQTEERQLALHHLHRTCRGAKANCPVSWLQVILTCISAGVSCVSTTYRGSSSNITSVIEIDLACVPCSSGPAVNLFQSPSRLIMDTSAPRSASRPRPTSRPTTPLRPSSRSSIRNSHGYGSSINAAGYEEPAINSLEPQFAELADSMADLEANFMHLQLMHESLSRFSESFASFLYGLNMNAFCVDFPEVVILT